MRIVQRSRRLPRQINLSELPEITKVIAAGWFETVAQESGGGLCDRSCGSWGFGWVNGASGQYLTLDNVVQNVIQGLFFEVAQGHGCFAKFDWIISLVGQHVIDLFLGQQLSCF